MDICIDPSKEELERLVGAGLSDAEIATHLTGGTKTASWAKDKRIQRKVFRRKGGAIQVGRAIIDPVFLDDRERDIQFERVRHGECDLAEIMAYTGCREQEIVAEWRQWISRCHDRPLENIALRRARQALTDDSLSMMDKLQALFGRRIRIVENQLKYEIFLDGERMTLVRAIKEGNIEAADLGLPPIARGD